MKMKRIHLKTALMTAWVLALCAVPARAGVNIRCFVGYGLYPYAATDIVTTAPGTGLLANNGSGRALVQLIYAGANGAIGDGSNRVDLANAANGYVAGDDMVWQSTVIEAGVNDVDEWGFTSTLPGSYINEAWAASGRVFARVYQDDTPQYGDAFFDSQTMAFNPGLLDFSPNGDVLAIETGSNSGPTSGVALNQRILTTTNLVRSIESNQWDLMSVPLIVSPTNKFGLVASNAAVSSWVYFYDPAISNFAGVFKSAKGWGPASNRIVLPGESFFLKSPPDLGNEIAMAGEVPVGPVTNQVYARWSALGYPYPEDIAWTDTSLASNLPPGTLVYFWDVGGQKYQICQKGPPIRGGWGAGASNHIIHTGDGFIVRQPPGAASFLWIQERKE